MPDYQNKIPPWYRGPPTDEERYVDDPDHYTRSGYPRIRADGDWYRCYEPGCPHVHPSRGYIAKWKHFEEYHGHAPPEPSELIRKIVKVPPHEGERLKKVFEDWRRAQKNAMRPKTPFDKEGVPIPGAAPLVQDFGNVRPNNAQLLQHVGPAAPQVVRVNQPGNNGPREGAGEARPTVIKHQCYICRRRFTRSSYLPSHVFTQHGRALLREPYQSGRVISVECYEDTGEPIRLVACGEPQRPQFSFLCDELKELILQNLLIVPTDYDGNKGPIDKNIFKAFSIDKATREHALAIFAKYNFMIRVSIRGLDLDAIDAIEDYMSRNLQVVPHAMSENVGPPALTIQLNYDEGPEDGRNNRRNWRNMLSPLVFTERSFSRLCDLIQKDMPRLQALEIRFADWAGDHRHRGTKETIAQYLGYLRGVRQLCWYEEGHLMRTDITHRMCAIRDLENEVVQDARELVVLLQEQMQRSMFGAARMTLDWLLNVASIGQVPSQQILGPAEGSEYSRRVQNANRQLYEEVVTMRRELKELVARAKGLKPTTDNTAGEFLRSYNAFVEQQKTCMLFPGVTDQVRARMHLASAHLYTRYAHQLLRIYQASGWAPTEAEIQESLNAEDNIEMTEEQDQEQEQHQDEEMTDVEQARDECEEQLPNDEQMIDKEEDEELRTPRRRSSTATPSGSSGSSDDALSVDCDEGDLFQMYPESMMVELAISAIRETCWAAFLVKELDNVDDDDLLEGIDSIATPFGHNVDADTELDYQPLLRRYGPGGYHLSFEWKGDPELAQKWFDHGFRWDRLCGFQKRPEGWEEDKEEVRERVTAVLDDIEAKRRNGLTKAHARLDHRRPGSFIY